MMTCLGGQAYQIRAIELNFKQLLMQRQIGLVGRNKSKTIGKLVKLNNLTGDHSMRGEIDRIDTSTQ